MVNCAAAVTDAPFLAMDRVWSPWCLQSCWVWTMLGWDMPSVIDASSQARHPS